MQSNHNASLQPGQLADIQTLQAGILEIVAKYDRVSFAELPRRLSDLGIIVDRGDEAIVCPGNIVVWVKMSLRCVTRFLDSSKLVICI